MPARDRRAVRADEAGAPSSRISPRIEPRHAEERQRELGAAGAEQADEADDLAGVQGEGDVGEFAGAACPPHLEQRRRPPDVAARRSRVLDALAGHQLGEAVVVDLGGGEGADLAAVAQHRDPLGDLDHLVEPVADEDDSDALRLQPRAIAASSRSTSWRVSEAVGSSMKRMPGIGGEAAADGDDLALRDRQRADTARRAAGRRRAGRAPPAPSRASAAAAAAAAAPPSSRSMAIFSCDREVREQRQVLEDDLDAERSRPGAASGAQCATPSIDDLGAGIGRMDAGQDLDQRRFARAVLADQAVHLAWRRPTSRCRRAPASRRTACSRRRGEGSAGSAAAPSVIRGDSFGPGLSGPGRALAGGPMRRRQMILAHSSIVSGFRSICLLARITRVSVSTLTGPMPGRSMPSVISPPSPASCRAPPWRSRSRSGSTGSRG